MVTIVTRGPPGVGSKNSSEFGSDSKLLSGFSLGRIGLTWFWVLTDSGGREMGRSVVVKVLPGPDGRMYLH